MADQNQPETKQPESTEESKQPIIAQSTPVTSGTCYTCKQEFKYKYVVYHKTANDPGEQYSVCTPCMEKAQFSLLLILMKPESSEQEKNEAKRVYKLLFGRPIHFPS